MVGHSEVDRRPMLDRIDLHVEVPAVAYKEMRGEERAGPYASPASQTRRPWRER